MTNEFRTEKELTEEEQEVVFKSIAIKRAVAVAVDEVLKTFGDKKKPSDILILFTVHLDMGMDALDFIQQYTHNSKQEIIKVKEKAAALILDSRFK